MNRITRIFLLGVMCLLLINPVLQIGSAEHLSFAGVGCLFVAVALFLVVGADWATDDTLG